MALIDTLPTPLRRIINETAAWSLPRLDASNLAACWRSEDVRPKYFEPSRAATVAGLVSDRRSRLGTVGTPKAGPGRLLAYFPDAELSDGAAEFESHGFFDVYNEPPWDAWVAWHSLSTNTDQSYIGFLVAWIPVILVPMVTRAIYVDPADSLVWLEDVPKQHREALLREWDTA